MKKIPTVYERVFEGNKVIRVLDKVAPGMEWVLEGKGKATMTVDGSCCAIISGELYKRSDAKAGKQPPEGAIPCCDPDPVTGHWPHWVKCDRNNKGDKWFWAAYDNAKESGEDLSDWTFEAIGKHFQGNPYNIGYDTLVRHGAVELGVERSYEGIKKYLETMPMEGIVFWLDGQPMCKIKRKDFGFEWPVRWA